MPPKPRDAAAGLFHVWTHCVWAAPALFRDDVDAAEFLRHLARVTRRTGWSCLAYCLMGTHYHLLVRAEDGVLPIAMHGLNLGYARHYNRRHGLRGHVHAARYSSRRLHDHYELAIAFAYVANNPVRAGLCAAPAAWPLSTYGGTIGLGQLSSFVEPHEVLRGFESTGIDARAALRVFVERASA